MSVQEKMTAIADAIRSKTGKTEPLGLDGMAAGVGEVYAAGQKSEYDRFWDTYQDNGNRTDYQGAFYGVGWNVETFLPKYSIKPTAGSSMFQYARFGGCDLVQLLENLGVELSFEDCTAVQNAFMMAGISHIGTVDTRNAPNLNYLFDQGYNYLTTVDEVLLKNDGSQTFTNTFRYCYTLQEIRISGTIGQNGLNLQWSTNLSRGSIESIINALSADTSGLTVTLSKTAVQTAFAEEEWYEFIKCRPNWTISFI